MKILLISMLVFMAIAPQPVAVDPPATDPATQVLALLNDWRIQQGLWPLKVNPTLQAMAEAQAQYVVANMGSINVESDYHLDALKQMPAQRAIRAPYLWPTYG